MQGGEKANVPGVDLVSITRVTGAEQQWQSVKCGDTENIQAVARELLSRDAWPPDFAHGPSSACVDKGF